MSFAFRRTAGKARRDTEPAVDYILPAQIQYCNAIGNKSICCCQSLPLVFGAIRQKGHCSDLANKGFTGRRNSNLSHFRQSRGLFPT